MTQGDAFRRWVAVAATAGVGVVALLAAPGGGSPGRTVAVALSAAVAAAVTVPIALGRGMRFRTPSWLFLGAAAGAFAIGQVGRAVWAGAHHGAVLPFPHWSDVAFALTAPLMAAGMIVLRTNVVSVTRVRRFVEACITAASLFFIGWALVIGSAFHRASGNGLERGFAVVYVSGGMMAVSLAASFIVRLRTGRRHDRDNGRSVPVHGHAVGVRLPGRLRHLPAGYGPRRRLVDHVPALRARGARAPLRGQEGEDVGARWRDGPCPARPVLAVVGTAAWMAAHGEFLGPMLTVAALILAVLVVLRQMLTAFENRTLTGNLADRIEELSEREHQLRHQAFHDSLTGLANRALFLDRVEHALTLRSHRRLALLFLDIDDFKLVNDSLGHSAGDELITAVGQRLRAVSRHGDTVARLGGDEFGILIEGLARRQDAEIVAGRLLDAVRSPLTIDGVC